MSENDPEFHKFRAQIDREGTRGERQKEITEDYKVNAEKIWGKKTVKTMSDEDRKKLGVQKTKRIISNY